VFVCAGLFACKKAPPETGPIKVGAIINLTLGTTKGALARVLPDGCRLPL